MLRELGTIPYPSVEAYLKKDSGRSARTLGLLSAHDGRKKSHEETQPQPEAASRRRQETTASADTQPMNPMRRAQAEAIAQAQAEMMARVQAEQDAMVEMRVRAAAEACAIYDTVALPNQKRAMLHKALLALAAPANGLSQGLHLVDALRSYLPKKKSKAAAATKGRRARRTRHSGRR